MKMAREAVPNYPITLPIYSPLQDLGPTADPLVPTYVYYVVRKSDLTPKPHPTGSP